MTTAGALFTQGCQVNIREVNSDGHMQFDSPLVDLPTYSWNHSQRFWHDSRVDNEFLARTAPKPGILGARFSSVTEGEQLWKGFLQLSEAPWIADHKIQGSILYPGGKQFPSTQFRIPERSGNILRIPTSWKVQPLESEAILAPFIPNPWEAFLFKQC